MADAGVLTAALLFGLAVGFANNAASTWAHRLAAAEGTPARAWPAAFALQFVVRLALSFASLALTYRASGGNPFAVLLNLAGLFLARYYLLWRLARGGAGGVA
ncbi:MAG: hypothetical protein AB1645_03510 [Bacillota bacterium]